MPTSHKSSLRVRLLLLVALIVFLGYALTLTVLAHQAGKLQHEGVLRYTEELAPSQTTPRAEKSYLPTPP